MGLFGRRRARREAARDELAAELRRPQNRGDDPPPHRKSAPGAWLAGANLRNADLRWADLEGANLEGADLSGARLHGANCAWARFHGADLRSVDFGTCRLVEADLSGADVTGADFSRVTGLTWAVVRDVEGFRAATWPPGVDLSPPHVAGPVIRGDL